MVNNDYVSFSVRSLLFFLVLIIISYLEGGGCDKDGTEERDLEYLWKFCLLTWMVITKIFTQYALSYTFVLCGFSVPAF